MDRINGCSRESVKEVLNDLTKLLSRKLRYDRCLMGENGIVEKYSIQYLELIKPDSSFKLTDDTKALNLEETVDYILWLLLSKNDHPLKTDSDRSRVKGYANLNSRSNPSVFFKGHIVKPNGAELLADMLNEVFYEKEAFTESDDNKEFISRYNTQGIDDLNGLFLAVAGHLAVLINESSFMPSNQSESDFKSGKIVYNDNKPKLKKKSTIISDDMLSTAADDNIETNLFLEEYYHTKEAEKLGAGICLLIRKYRLTFIDEKMTIMMNGFKVEFDAFDNVIALKKVGSDSFSGDSNGPHVNDNIILPEVLSDKPYGHCRFYFKDSMYYEFELSDDSTIYRNSIMKYPIDLHMEPYRLDLTKDKIRIEFYKTMLYFGIRFSMDNRP